MTRDEILSMAREAGLIQFSCDQKDGYIRDGVYAKQLADFAKLAITRHLAHSPPAPLVVSMSDVDQAQLAAMLANAPAMPLVAGPDESKLAACFDQIKSDLIADGAVEHDLRLEFFPEAVLDAFRRQRAARIEAQQRLADLQEQLVRADAERCAAVVAEREACAVVCDELQDVPATEPRHCAADIRARGAA